MKTNAEIAMLLLMAGVFGAPAAAKAQDRHLDDLALEVQRGARDVCLELHHHYRGQHDFRTVYRECYEMFSIARLIHDIAHHGGSESRIARYTADLDDLFHHLEGDFHRWGMPDWHGYCDQGGRDSHDSHGGHHAGASNHGRHSRLARKMCELGEALHHLMDDVGHESRHVSPYGPPTPDGDASDPPRL